MTWKGGPGVRAGVRVRMGQWRSFNGGVDTGKHGPQPVEAAYRADVADVAEEPWKQTLRCQERWGSARKRT